MSVHVRPKYIIQKSHIDEQKTIVLLEYTAIRLKIKDYTI